MSETLAAPLVAPEVDLRGLPFMPLDIVRLLDSDIFALSTGDEFKAAVALWGRSWLQVPAASLPDDDRVLAHLSGAGARWKKVKPMALRGWIKCSDGRWYHPVVAEKAAEAWKHRLAQRARADKRWGNDPNRVRPGKTGDALRSVREEAARDKGTHTDIEWQAMVQACGNRCVFCGSPGPLTKDHIQPVSKGGADSIENLQPACISCNSGRGGDTDDRRPAGALDYVRRQCHGIENQSHGNATAMQGRVKGQGEGQGHNTIKALGAVDLALDLALALREAGMMQVNSQHPSIQQMAQDGATRVHVLEALRISRTERGKPNPSPAYLLPIVMDMLHTPDKPKSSTMQAIEGVAILKDELRENAK